MRYQAELPRVVLTINGGSSSIKFAVYTLGEANAEPQRGLAGQLDRIGLPGTRFTVRYATTGQPSSQPVEAAASQFLLDWLARQAAFATVQAVGHRVVHGGPAHQEPEVIIPALLSDLQRLIAYDPDRLPGETGLIAAFQARHPHLPQVACSIPLFTATCPSWPISCLCRVATRPMACDATAFTACPTPTC